MIVEADTACSCNIRTAVNFNERVDGVRPDMLILHYTGMETGPKALEWLCCEESQVSCHYLVEEDGSIFQMVPEKMRAWHAGKSFWQGERDINSRSIGIEIVNPGHEFGYQPFPDIQIASVIRLGLDIVSRNEISASRVLAHSDVAPSRKTDPGELFPWDALHARGLGHFVTPEPINSGKFFQLGDHGEPVSSVQSMLALYGYEIEISGQFCEQTASVVTAFQRHFRPEKVDGVADMSTVTTLYNLLSGLKSS